MNDSDSKTACPPDVRIQATPPDPPDRSFMIELVRLPKTVQELIGAVAARAGQLEHVLAVAVRRTEDITMQQAFKMVAPGGELYRRQDLNVRVTKNLEGLAKQNALSCDVNGLMQRVKDLQLARDAQAIHCCYAVKRGTRQVMHVRHGVATPIDRDGLKALADDLLEVTAALNAITRADLVSYADTDRGRVPKELAATATESVIFRDTPRIIMVTGVDTRPIGDAKSKRS